MLVWKSLRIRVKINPVVVLGDTKLKRDGGGGEPRHVHENLQKTSLLMTSTQHLTLTMTDSKLEDELPPGEPAPEVLEGRIWVDGCWDFFHHGTTLAAS